MLKKLLKALGVILLAFYFLFGAIIYFFQDNFIYYPTTQDFNSCQNFNDYEKININGTRAYVKVISNKWLVFYHGNAGSACDRAFLKPTFEKYGYSIIFVEYTGYSNDSKKPNQTLLKKNVENINSYINKQSPNKLIIIGESLGTSLAVYHSSMANENKLLLFSPFTSLGDIAKKHFGIYPTNLMIKNNYLTVSWLNDINNLLVICGEKDELIPYSISLKLFKMAITPNKKIISVPNAGHNNLYNFKETQDAINSFFQ